MSLSSKYSSSQKTEAKLATSGKIYACVKDASLILRFQGDVRLVWCMSLEEYCRETYQRKGIKHMLVDLSEASNLDSTTLGVLAKIALSAKKQLAVQAELFFETPDIERLVACMGFNQVFTIIDKPALPKLTNDDFVELCLSNMCEDTAKTSVIDAHKTLMDISKENEARFKPLVDSLENTDSPNNKS